MAFSGLWSTLINSLTAWQPDDLFGFTRIPRLSPPGGATNRIWSPFRSGARRRKLTFISGTSTPGGWIPKIYGGKPWKACEFPCPKITWNKIGSANFSQPNQWSLTSNIFQNSIKKWPKKNRQNSARFRPFQYHPFSHRQARFAKRPAVYSRAMLVTSKYLDGVIIGIPGTYRKAMKPCGFFLHGISGPWNPQVQNMSEFVDDVDPGKKWL